MYGKSGISRPDDIIYVQHSVVTGVPQQVTDNILDPDDSWSQGTDDGHPARTDSGNHQACSNPVTGRTTSHPNWSDEGRNSSESSQEDSAVISVADSGSLSDSDGPSIGSAAMAAANAMTQPAPVARQLHAHQAPARKCYAINSTGPILIALSLAGLGSSTYLFLQGTDVIPRPAGVDGKPVDTDRFLMAGVVLTLISIVVGVAGGCITKFCWKKG